MNFNLNGNDWILTGWLKHQWTFSNLLESSGVSLPVVMPVPASVPGSVQTDLRQAGVIEDWNTGLNFLNQEWIEHREWSYEKRFYLPKNARGEWYLLCFDGLDFNGYVFLNGHEVLQFDQMHIPYQIDVTDQILLDSENHLRIIFQQPPEVDGQVGYTSRTNILKSRFNYCWDWSPRLVNIGIFGDVYLRCIRKAYFNDVYPKTSIKGTDALVELIAEVEFVSECAIIVNVIVHRNGLVCATAEKIVTASDKNIKHIEMKLSIPDIKLWYANGHPCGRELYTVETKITDMDGNTLDNCEKQVGFRELTYHTPEGASQDSLPYSIYLNGEWLPIRGVNWVPISPFYGAVTEYEYRYYLNQLRQMNINLLRVWGGSLLESDIFYKICDELGFLIWQEFPQSSSGIDNTPCMEPAFIEALEKTARSYVIRRRHHASLAIWCAGNELYDEFIRPMDPDNPNFAALSSVVDELDSGRLFLPGSPSGKAANWSMETANRGIHGDTHGPWIYQGPYKHYEQFNADDSLLHSEVGTAACPREETIRRFCGEQIWPPSANNPYWLSRGSWWLYDKELAELFGPFDGESRGLNEYVKAYRYIQMEALRYAAISIRKAGRKKSGIVIWMANEPFPNNANTSIMEFDGCPKPAFYKLQAAFSNVMFGLKYTSPSVSGRKFAAELYACSDREIMMTGICVTVYDMAGNLLKDIDIDDTLITGATILANLTLPAAPPAVLVRVTGFTDRKLCEEYAFTVGGETVFGALLDLSGAKLTLSHISENRFLLQNTGAVPAMFIDCNAIGSDGRPLVVNNNYRCLMQGESIEVYAESPCMRLTAEAMNSCRIEYLPQYVKIEELEFTAVAK